MWRLRLGTGVGIRIGSRWSLHSDAGRRVRLNRETCGAARPLEPRKARRAVARAECNVSGGDSSGGLACSGALADVHGRANNELCTPPHARKEWLSRATAQ